MFPINTLYYKEKKYKYNNKNLSFFFIFLYNNLIDIKNIYIIEMIIKKNEAPGKF